jgi:uncharacterized protein (TIGR02145 family)
MTLPASPAVGTYTIDIEYSEAAHAAPSITGTSPSGAQPQGTTSVTLSATTNINSTCKYSTLDQAYNDMPSTMSGTTTSHTASVAVTANTNYTYYVRCQSSYGATMTSSSTISFSIPAAGLTSGSNMQSATTALCNATTAGTTVNLTDTRDGKVYRVRKMADNRCWMIDNLAFDLANANAPAYNPTEQLVSGTTTSVNTMAQYFLNSAYDTAAGADTYLYNWCAAMGDDSTDCLVTRLYSSGQPTIPVTGICPAPFRLPIGGSAATNSDTSTTKNEFAKLDIAMGGTGTNRDNANTYSNWMGTDASSSAWGGVFSSHVGSSGAIGSAGPRGFWWSSSGYTSTGDGVPTANVLQLMSSGNRVDPVQAYEKRLGFAVRCVL